MATINGDNLTDAVEIVYSVKDLRARKQEIQGRIDQIKLEPEQFIVENDKAQRIDTLRIEKQKIVDILAKVSLT